MSAMAEVRVKRGSTWITVAPFPFASMTKRKAIGWFSAMLDPITRTQSELAKSHWASVGGWFPGIVAPKQGTAAGLGKSPGGGRPAPPPVGAPKPGHKRGVKTPVLFSREEEPGPAAEELLDQVVLFVVERGAAERAD